MNKTSNITIWLDRDLTKTLKNEYDILNLNKELKFFFENKYDHNNTETTLDSLPEVKNICHYIHKFAQQLNTLRESSNFISITVTEIGTTLVYDDDDNSECDSLSTYYTAFDESKKQIQHNQEDRILHSLINKDFLERKTEQIIKFYNINNNELDQCTNNKQKIEFLLNHINSNKDIVHLLKHNKIINQRGKPYTANHIAKKRYYYKKNKIDSNYVLRNK